MKHTIQIIKIKLVKDNQNNLTLKGEKSNQIESRN